MHYYHLNIETTSMAEEENKEAQQQPYQFTPEGGAAGNSSKDFTGKGLANYPNGEVYEGEYVEGKRSGKGKYTYSNGDKYEGEFKDNLKHGIGRLTYSNKSEYYGTKSLTQVSSTKEKRRAKDFILTLIRMSTLVNGAMAKSMDRELTCSTRQQCASLGNGMKTN